MGFMNDKQQREKKPNLTYLEVEDGGSRRVRPLKKIPSSRWVHAINSVEQTDAQGKPQTIRYFATIPCISVNKSGQGCDPCITKDPLWHLLEPQQQKTQKGVVTHFPKRQQFELAVWDYELNDVRILRGKQVFEGMNTWWDSRKLESEKDASRLDWIVSKKGVGDRTKWTITPDEVSKLEITEEMKLKLQECELRAAAESRMPTHEEFLKKIYGSSGLNPSEAPQAPSSAAVTSTVASVAAAQNESPFVDDIPKAPAQVSTAATKPATSVASASAKPAFITEFAQWLASVPEFQGAGLTRNLIPALQSKAGTVAYQSLPQEQIVELKQHLESVVAKLRGA